MLGGWVDLTPLARNRRETRCERPDGGHLARSVGSEDNLLLRIAHRIGYPTCSRLGVRDCVNPYRRGLASR